nr:MAG TPA: hypothetical protein [Caudoviricetes sp.]
MREYEGLVGSQESDQQIITVCGSRSVKNSAFLFKLIVRKRFT